MPIEIIESINPPKMTKIKMLCDVEIHDKLSKIDVINKHFNKSNTTVICGRQGAGKSSILMNFVKIYKKCFHKIYVFMRESSRASLENNVFDTELASDQLFEDLTAESLAQVYEEIKENTKKGWFSWIIFDDVQDALKNNEVVKILNRIVANQRHLKVINFILLQNFYALSDKVRKLTNNLFLFHLDKKQMEQIYENYIEVDKKDFAEVCKLAYNEPHDFLLINLNYQEFYNSEFQELKITE